MQPSPVFGQFTSKASSAGDVYLEIGFIPDYIIVWVDMATAFNILEWYNNEVLTQVPSASGAPTGHWLTTGSTGARTHVTTAGQIIEAYAGGDSIDLDPTTGIQGTTDETTDSDPKHVNLDGTAGVAGHTTSPGVLIPKEGQVASGINFYAAYRVGR